MIYASGAGNLRATTARPNNLKSTLFRVNYSDWLIAEFVGLTSVGD